MTVNYAPDRAYRIALGAGLIGLVALAGIALLWPRKRVHTSAAGSLPTDTRSMPVLVLGSVAFAAGGLLGGWVGAAAALLGFLLALGLTHRMDASSCWVLAGLILPTVAAYAVRPWASDAGWAGSLAWPGYLVIFVSGALLGSALSAPRPSPLSRRAGSSTNR